MADWKLSCLIKVLYQFWC